MSSAAAAPQTVTPELRAWIVEQARAGCRPDDVLAAMKASGWDEDVAVDALERTLREALGAQPPAVQPLPEPAARLPEPDLSARPSIVRAGGRDVRVVASLAHPRVVVFGDFLGDDECEQLIAAARPRMARSQTVELARGGNEINPARTSEGMFFGRGESELATRIERRIAELLRWPVENGEGLQVLRYRPGAEYKPHHDYFDPTQPGMAPVIARGGQRVATLVMYLNTPERGGATTFPDVGLEIGAVRGHAVFFSYERPHPTTKTLHGGAPVEAGEKWVATKWLREREFV